jgi:hypothetical protein
MLEGVVQPVAAGSHIVSGVTFQAGVLGVALGAPGLVLSGDQTVPVHPVQPVTDRMQGLARCVAKGAVGVVVGCLMA